MLHDVPTSEFAKAFTKGVQRNSTGMNRLASGPAHAAFEAQIRATGKVRRAM
jgi:hypothetical protein